MEEKEIRRRKPTIDTRIERQIITGMILNDDFPKSIIYNIYGDWSNQNG